MIFTDDMMKIFDTKIDGLVGKFTKYTKIVELWKVVKRYSRI